MQTTSHDFIDWQLIIGEYKTIDLLYTELVTLKQPPR